MQDGPVGFEVETLNIEDAAVACLHQYGDAALARRLAHEELDVERVALLDNQIEPFEEPVEIVGADTLEEGIDPKVRIDLTDATGRNHRLVPAEVEHTGRNAVEVREVDRVEVSEPQFSRQAFH